MIVFTLRCAHDHSFEEWFDSGADFEARAAAGDIACPQCGDTHVEKGIMAPSIGGQSRQSVPACEAPACASGACGCPWAGD